jgi:hypothetical protein
MTGRGHDASLADRRVRVPGPVPDRPADCLVAPPDFVGVGVQRSGTTRWFDLILEHPRVVAPAATRKELHYFDRFHNGGFTSVDATAYATYFPRPAGSFTGEWTPTYMTDFWVPPLLQASAPGARLLVLLRDPVERYLSGLQRRYRVAQASRNSLDQHAPFDEYARGLYGAQLERLLASVDRERVLVLQYERCVESPAGELRRTFAFLGLDSPEIDSGVLDRHPNRQPTKPLLDPETRKALASAYLPDVQRLLRLYPELDIGAWPHFEHVRP